MDLKYINRSFFFIAFFLTGILFRANAQVVVEKSNDKVIISGTTFYIHTVKKGETAYSVSRAYGVTIDELTKENPPAVYGLKEGQTLRIPYREVPDEPPQTVFPVHEQHDYDRFIYHQLRPGETVYSLSKLYGVSDDQIISANPGIDITELPVGAEIAVPRKEFMTGKQEFAIQSSKYLFHKVEQGESLSSIAEKYGITLRILRRENRNIRFPQVGDYLRIPLSRIEQPHVGEVPGIQPEDTLMQEQEPADSVILLPRPEEYIPVTDLKGTLDVAVLLPFYLNENARRTYIDSSRYVNGKPVYRTVKRPDDWIYPRSLAFIEMYEGILLAADTLRSLGLNINLNVYDIKDDTLELSRLIKNGTLADVDLVIGPVYSSNLSLLSDYLQGKGIPIVSPVPVMSDTVLNDHPELFLSVSSIDVAQDAIAKKVGEYFYSNVVFIHADTAGIERDVMKFREKILNELSSRMPDEQIRFRELLFYSRSLFSSDSINRLEHALSENVNYITVIASEDAAVFGETLMDIHSLSRQYDISVFGYPVIRQLDNLDPKYLFDLDLLLFSPYWIDYSKKDVRQFNSDFVNKFMTQPSESSYAWIGYDILYYFASGLALFGHDFISHPEIHYPDLLRNEFEFRRERMNDGFENIKLFPVRFSHDYEVRLEPERKTEPF